MAHWLGAHTGVMATNVEDAALAYAALKHRHPRSTGDPGRLRIAATNVAPLPARVDDDATKWLLKAVRSLTDLGHETFRAKPRFGARLTQRSQMLASVTLQREHPDPGSHEPSGGVKLRW